MPPLHPWMYRVTVRNRNICFFTYTHSGLLEQCLPHVLSNHTRSSPQARPRTGWNSHNTESLQSNIRFMANLGVHKAPEDCFGTITRWGEFSSAVNRESKSDLSDWQSVHLTASGIQNLCKYEKSNWYRDLFTLNGNSTSMFGKTILDGLKWCLDID